ncbi:MAG: hypothetical protein AB8G05_18600 [Oligoflexales bacterium]
MNSTLLSLVLLLSLFGCGFENIIPGSKSEKSNSQEAGDETNSDDGSQGNSNPGDEEDDKEDECNFHSLISSTYASDFGDIKLEISSDNSVEGDYSYDGYEGKIEGLFDKKTLKIEGNYREFKERIILPSSEETGNFVIEFSVDDCKQVKVVESSYQEEGGEEWEP